MPKYLIRLEGNKGYGSDHLFKAQKDYTCRWCNKNIPKGDLYARHTPNKFNENTYPVCRDCAWWLKDR